MIQCQQCGTEMSEGGKFCPECGHEVGQQASPNVSSAGQKPKNKKWLIAGLMALVVILGLSSYLKVMLRTYHPVIENQPSIVIPISYGVEQKHESKDIEARMKNGSIVVPLAEVKENKIVRFFDPEMIQSVPLLAYITPEGKLVTAMSKSEQCGSTEFYLQGHMIHCARCPSYWNMSSLEAYACCQRFYPDPIPSTLQGDKLVIDPKAVREWKSRI